jgi:tetratricopeptide (TPR) repeat protein
MPMRTIYFITLLASVAPLMAQTAVIVPEKKASIDQTLSPNQKAFLNMPEEKRKEFAQHYNEASRLFQQKRIFEAMDEIDKAQKVFPDSPEMYNLRGSCYIEMRAFDKSLIEFEKAQKLSPTESSIKFNMAEVYFVTGEWKKSLDIFGEIFETTSSNNVAMARLIEFKMMLCKKKLGLKDEAMVMSKKYDFMDDSPYHYFAEAALAYDQNNTTKAEEWLAIAARIFRTDTNTISAWQDTFVEYGYIKSFYGDDAKSAK